jgi:DNA-binding response OmpR family regulator
MTIQLSWERKILPGYTNRAVLNCLANRDNMERHQERILIIDDDRELCSLLAEYLKPEGFIVDNSFQSKEGLEMAINGQYNLVILDVMLPGQLNGFNVLQSIRTKTAVPVLMLSARGEDVDRIVGLEMGADDYLPKPFNPRELLARIRTILRRLSPIHHVISGDENGSGYKIGDLDLDTSSRRVQCANRPVELTGVEFDLLTLLIKNAGQVLTRDHLTAEVLGRSLSPYDRSIDVHISKLRKKLGLDSSGNERIKSIRGSGYVYTAFVTANNHQTNNQATQ